MYIIKDIWSPVIGKYGTENSEMSFVNHYIVIQLYSLALKHTFVLLRDGCKIFSLLLEFHFESHVYRKKFILGYRYYEP